MAIALVDSRNQGFPDVAREVQVDVRQRGQLLVQKAPDQQLIGDRIDVREAGQVADNRGHARAAAAPGRQQRPRAVWAAHLDRDLARQLEQIVVEQEEAGQPQRLDDPQLLKEAAPRALAHRSGRTRISLRKAGVAQLRERAHSLLVLGAWIPVTEV